MGGVRTSRLRLHLARASGAAACLALVTACSSPEPLTWDLRQPTTTHDLGSRASAVVTAQGPGPMTLLLPMRVMTGDFERLKAFAPPSPDGTVADPQAWQPIDLVEIELVSTYDPEELEAALDWFGNEFGTGELRESFLELRGRITAALAQRGDRIDHELLKTPQGSSIWGVNVLDAGDVTVSTRFRTWPDGQAIVVAILGLADPNDRRTSLRIQDKPSGGQLRPALEWPPRPG